MALQKITPFLWFDRQAEEAANFYTSIFPNSRIVKVVRRGKSETGPTDQVMVVDFELEGQSFAALNGGPMFKFTEAISFVVNCDSQEELHHYWEKLSEGGKEVQCGWLKDKFGLSWQIVPRMLTTLLQKCNAEQTGRVMKVVMSSIKLDIAKLQEAYDRV